MNDKFEVLMDIIMHISEVQQNLNQITAEIEQRGISHDRTKYQAIEFDAFVKTRPAFKKAEYGTKEYQECIDIIKPSIDHHYANNRHHTAYHGNNGFANMNLIDILEMLADWKAAARRSPDLSFYESLTRAYKKYSIPENMIQHIENTLEWLGWI